MQVERHTKRWRWLLALTCTVLIVTVLMRAFRGQVSSPETKVVTLGTIKQRILVTGVVAPIREVKVGGQVTGQIKQIYVTLGDEVRDGELLVRIDPALQLNELNRARYQFQAQKQRLASMRSKLTEAQWELARQIAMDVGDATSGLDVQRARNSAVVAFAQLKEGEAMLAQYDTKLAAAKVTLAFTKVLSPMSGEIIGIAVRKGQIINAHFHTPTLLTIGNLSRVVVHCLVPEADVDKIQIGQRVTFTPLANKSRTYTSKVMVIEPVPKKTHGGVFYTVLFVLSNRDKALLVGMTGLASFHVASVVNVPTIPIEAISKRIRRGWYRVYVYSRKRRTVGARDVHIGMSNDVSVQILKGVRIGERVVVGHSSLTSGLTK